METDISQEPIVVAVVLNYLRPLDTLACLSSIRDSSYSSLRILVVDNASPDDSVNRIRNSHPDIEVIESKINGGYAGGMNIGIRYAMKFSPEYLLLVNSDTIVAEDFIEKLVEVMNVHQRAAAVSGTIYYFPEKEKIWYAGGTMRYWRASGFTHHTLPEYRKDITIDAIPVSFISGCGFLVRVSSLEQVGLFNEQFFMYLEDTELCSRFLKNNFELLYLPTAKLYHKVINNKTQAFQLYFSVRNRLFFLKLSAKRFTKFVGNLYFFSVLVLKGLF